MNITNRGTGAGGANTNGNGLSYEALTCLDDCINLIEKNKNYEKISFHNNKNKILISTKQSKFIKCMDNHRNKSISIAHGCKNPDECYIYENKIFIIEKKFQQTSGSVCEKIQTGVFKRHHYSELYPDFTIIYIYCLSDWFKENCLSELAYLRNNNIPVFWGSSLTYKQDIIQFIINYT